MTSTDNKRAKKQQKHKYKLTSYVRKKCRREEEANNKRTAD